MHHIMEFILPLLSASGEGVIMLLIVVVLFMIGRGRMQPSEKTLVIERPGQYRMVLAPGLNLAQPFLEAIARQVTERARAAREGALLQFEVRDREVATTKCPAYLLTISLRGGILHFEAGSLPAALSENSAATLPGSTELAEDIEYIARTLAESWGIGFHRINARAIAHALG